MFNGFKVLGLRINDLQGFTGVRSKYSSKVLAGHISKLVEVSVLEALKGEMRKG